MLITSLERRDKATDFVQLSMKFKCWTSVFNMLSLCSPPERLNWSSRKLRNRRLFGVHFMFRMHWPQNYIFQFGCLLNEAFYTVQSCCLRYKSNSESWNVWLTKRTQNISCILQEIVQNGELLYRARND